jgi:quinoprotein dehydrogenase-associated probable ABC transporter substrate-binding protein
MHGRLNISGTAQLRTGLHCALTALLCLLTAAASAQQTSLGAAGELASPDVLRVCSDPSNLPFSDQTKHGFENRIADLVAAKLGHRSVSYTWFPMTLGFVRNTLGAYRCDLIVGFAQGDELVQNTNPYYRSAYVLVYRPGSGLSGVETIEDPRLAGKRIGVVARTPPSGNMAAVRLMKTAKIYPLMIDTRLSPSMGELMIKDLVAGDIDAAIGWGPMIGYYAKQSGVDLTIVPLVKEKTGSRMTFRITMGVRPSDQEWKRRLNRFIQENQPEINRILREYSVPLIDEQDRPITE